jgi:hypothetical protein
VTRESRIHPPATRFGCFLTSPWRPGLGSNRL